MDVIDAKKRTKPKNQFAENNPNWRGGKRKCVVCNEPVNWRGNHYHKKCWYRYNSGINNHNWIGGSNGTYSRLAWIVYLKQYIKCAFCGTEKNIHIHHKDENNKNNKTNNLMLLCSACHLSLHAKNKKRTGNGRFMRKE